MKKQEDATPFVSIIIGVILCLLFLVFGWEPDGIMRNPTWAVASGMIMTGLASMTVYGLIIICLPDDE